MLNEHLKEKLSNLYQRITKGDLSTGGDVSHQMFLSTIDVILNDIKRDDALKIEQLENALELARKDINDLTNGK